MTRYTATAACLVATAALPLLGGCAAFRQGDVPAAPRVTVHEVEAQSWRDQIQRDPQGDTPTFGPLVEAENAVAAAKSQPDVNDYDSQSLSEAEQSLADAKKQWQAIANARHRSDAALGAVAAASQKAERLAQIARYTAMRETGLDQLNQLRSQQAASEAAQNQSSAVPSISDQRLVNKRVVPSLLGSLEFQQGTARLTDASHPVIKKLARLMSQHPKLGVAIFGFTDNSTPPENRLQAFVQANPQLAKQNPSHAEEVDAYRQGLSEARARDVAELLVEAGIDPNRIGARGLGDQHPIASNSTAAGRSENERAEAIMVPLSALGHR